LGVVEIADRVFLWLFLGLIAVMWIRYVESVIIFLTFKV